MGNARIFHSGGNRLLLFNESVGRIEECIGYTFRNKALLREAFIRSSWAEENICSHSCEVMEFIGDKVLDYLIVKRIVHRFSQLDSDVIVDVSDSHRELVAEYKYLNSGEYNEGRLTKIKARLVCAESLSAAVGRLGLQQYLIMSRGDEQNHVENETHVKEDLLEAILGAVAVDCGWDIPTLDALVDRLLDPVKALDEGLSDDNYTGLLQSWYQKRNDGALPEYAVAETAKGFRAEVNIHPELSEEYLQFTGREVVFTGFGRSKKEAVSEAARQAWERISAERDTYETFVSLVGEPDEERAVNQLQELWQKGYIEKPEYIFQCTADKDTGADLWTCECRLGTSTSTYSAEGNNKMEAKKIAAFCTAIELQNEPGRLRKA